jgi:S-adenosylmethionine:tRNA ribosyltransferase-isomerase
VTPAPRPDRGAPLLFLKMSRHAISENFSMLPAESRRGFFLCLLRIGVAPNSNVSWDRNRLRVKDFDFELPHSSIAMHPVEPRDAARLLVITPHDRRDRRIADLPSLLQSGDIIVFNDTRVIPTRLRGRRGELSIEVTLHRQLAADRWLAFAKGAKRLRAGDRLAFGPDAAPFEGEIVSKNPEGDVTIRFDRTGPHLRQALEQYGKMPLPPYIKRASGGSDGDRNDYQTIFAQHDGAVAAPTAGLHFTEGLLDALNAAGVEQATLTLHVGAGTFLPVKVDDTRDHHMHFETGVLSEVTAQKINDVRRRGGRVVAVGTTSLRLLESAADTDGFVAAYDGETNLFITPGYRFKAVDLLLTNFHLPRSTLFMLVAAFAGLERMRSAYEHAKETGYRFYSYGDACLLYPGAR